MDHVTDFLGPYLDGELQASHNAKIEKHLEICKSCRVELAELQKLGTLLQDNAQLPETKSEDQFVAEVGLLMKRQTEPTALKRVLVTGWKAIPVSLAGTWLFVQTSLIVTTLFCVTFRSGITWDRTIVTYVFTNSMVKRVRQYQQTLDYTGAGVYYT